MRTPMRLLTAAAIAIAASTSFTAPAQAAPTVKHYASCAAVHHVYGGGIAKKGVTKNTVHSHGKTVRRALKGHVKHSTALYKANRKRDRDKNGVACEKS